jgi:hypothetical protein
MKRIIIGLGLMTFTLGASAQGLEVYIASETEDVSGTTVEDVDGDLEAVFVVKNVSDSPVVIAVERVKLIVLEGTGDYLCWAEQCYDETDVAPFDPYLNPDEALLESDSSEVLISYHVTHEIAGCASYRYYFIDAGDVRRDSLDVLFCSTVSIDENQGLDITIFPNPVSEILTVSLDRITDNVGFELYNVLGDVVMTKNLIQGQNYLNVQALPNGVYFYSIMQEGNAVETKKLVVRH